MVNKNIILIGGGVGPAAGVLLHNKIINMTDNRNLKDQGHANLVHISFSQDIADRTDYLLHKKGENPGNSMSLKIQETAHELKNANAQIIVGVPCNTFHSHDIFAPFKKDLSDKGLIVLDMIEMTAKYIGKTYPGAEIILLSTKGTRDTKVYDQRIGGKLRKCNDIQQATISQAIYDERTGIKGKNPNLGEAADTFERTISELCSNFKNKPNRICAIMGCTEIPIAYNFRLKTAGGTGKLALKNFKNYIDPMDILAANMIARAGYKIKPEYEDLIIPDEGTAEPRVTSSKL